MTKNKTWKDIAGLLGIGASSSAAYTLRKHYTKHLLAYECHFDRGGVDPQPIINQVEAGSKKKGSKGTASVPSPGSYPRFCATTRQISHSEETKFLIFFAFQDLPIHKIPFPLPDQVMLPWMVMEVIRAVTVVVHQEDPLRSTHLLLRDHPAKVVLLLLIKVRNSLHSRLLSQHIDVYNFSE